MLPHTFLPINRPISLKTKKFKPTLTLERPIKFQIEAILKDNFSLKTK